MTVRVEVGSFTFIAKELDQSETLQQMGIINRSSEAALGAKAEMRNSEKPQRPVYPMLTANILLYQGLASSCV